MATLISENVPTTVWSELTHLALAQQQTPAETALGVIEQQFRLLQPTVFGPPPPSPIFLTEEIPAPFDFPRPEGELVIPEEVDHYVVAPHDLPGE